MGCSDFDHMYADEMLSVFSSGILLAAQANAGEIGALVMLISSEMPDEGTDRSTAQPPYRQTACFFFCLSVISSLTPEHGIHNEFAKGFKVSSK